MPVYLSTTLYFIVILHHFLFLIFWLFFSPFDLYKFDIIFSIQSIFSPQKNVSTLSLSLLLSREFLFFLIILIKVDFFLICVLVFYFIFKVSHYKVFSLPYIALVEFWFGLVFFFLEIGIWVYVKTHSTKSVF